VSFVQQGAQTRNFVADRRDALSVGSLDHLTLAQVSHASKHAFLGHQSGIGDVERFTVLQSDGLLGDRAASMAKAGTTAAIERTRKLSLRIMQVSLDDSHSVRMNRCGTAYESNVAIHP
jgi:hypothetical protein